VVEHMQEALDSTPSTTKGKKEKKACYMLGVLHTVNSFYLFNNCESVVHTVFPFFLFKLRKILG
jgi:hypothetical protein